MLIIGLTGNIGSGKSTVANMFAELGVPVIDADFVAREVTDIDTPAYKNIVDRFSIAILNEDRTLNRRKLREIIFADSSERRWMEALLHPIIVAKMKEDIDKLDTAYCIAVIPLLFESGKSTFIQRSLVVDVSPEAQLERAAVRDNDTVERIKAIKSTQMSRELQVELADDVIDNTGDLASLKEQVASLHQKYLELSSQH